MRRVLNTHVEEYETHKLHHRVSYTLSRGCPRTGCDVSLNGRILSMSETKMTRGKINAIAEIEQSMDIEQAQCLYNDTSERLSMNKDDQEAWLDKRRARARLEREDITEGTMT